MDKYFLNCYFADTSTPFQCKYMILLFDFLGFVIENLIYF